LCASIDLCQLVKLSLPDGRHVRAEAKLLPCAPDPDKDLDVFLQPGNRIEQRLARGDEPDQAAVGECDRVPRDRPLGQVEVGKTALHSPEGDRHPLHDVDLLEKQEVDRRKCLKEGVPVGLVHCGFVVSFDGDHPSVGALPLGALR